MMNKYPQALQTRILLRTYNEKDFEEILTRYEQVKLLAGKQYYEPNAREIKLFKE